MESRRRALRHLSVDSPTHPGLTLARYLPQQNDEHAAAKDLLNTILNATASDAYINAFQCWKATCERRKAACATFHGTLASPLALGLGGASVTEVGLTTHWTYGMPFIPGSALKGLCRRGLARWQSTRGIAQANFDSIETAMFGDTTDASHFTFWDAWYAPESTVDRPFHRDTITVHHPEYYSSRGEKAWPTDFDDPTPVAFLVVKPNTPFLFAVDAPSDEWRAFAVNLLQWSLAHVGIGGKTNAGYGYFHPGKWVMPPRRETWVECRLVRRNIRGRMEIQFVVADEVRQTLTESDWAKRKFDAAWTSAQRKQFNDSKLRVKVLVEIEGKETRILTVTPL